MRKQYPSKFVTQELKNTIQPELSKRKSYAYLGDCDEEAKRLIAQERAYTSSLNRPISSKSFNPDRLNSHIDFKSYGTNFRNEELATRPLRKQSHTRQTSSSGFLAHDITPRDNFQIKSARGGMSRDVSRDVSRGADVSVGREPAR